MLHSLSELLTPVQRDGLVAVVLLVLTGALGLAVARLTFSLLTKLAARRNNAVLGAVLRRAEPPSRFIFPLVAVEAALPYVTLPEWLKVPAERVAALCITVATAWVVITLVELLADLAKLRYRIDEPDNLRARQVETRLDILSRTVATLVVIIAVASMLMTFPSIRAVGATLLASAGLAGLAVGFAARPVLENIAAGVQIALTQPIRIDDLVVVQNETGRIEKITATYVVIKLLDRRRMVLPLTYFIDNPFQNLTYSTADLLGSVVLRIDYPLPLSQVRAELERLLSKTPLWDGQTAEVAMTDSTETIVEVRILVSARNSYDLFDLRCYVREHLVDYIRASRPEATPTTRVVVVPAPSAAGANGRRRPRAPRTTQRALSSPPEAIS